MRRILEVLDRYGHPVGIVTKSALVLRDLDILGRMAQRNLVKVALSVTTLDGKLARVMEPRAATPARRLDALRQLRAAGVPASVMVAPMIPALNDSEIERILDAAAAVGVKEAGYVLLRLPLEVRDLFREWLIANFPDRYRHVFKLIRDTRGGKDYDFELRQAHDRRRAGRLDDRPAFRARLREARLQQGTDKAQHGALRSAAARAGAAEPALSTRSSGPVSVSFLRLSHAGTGRRLTWAVRRAPSRHESSRSHQSRPPAARRGGHPSDLPPRARRHQARRLAGRGLRRGWPGAARRPGRCRGGHSRPQARAARARRFEEARSRDARKAPRQDLCDGRGRGCLRAAVAHRPRQHPASVAVGAGTRRRGAAGQAEARVRRRPRPHRRRLRLPGGDQRRRHHRLDCGRFHRRQGHARSADGAARACASGLWVRAATRATACPSISTR